MRVDLTLFAALTALVVGFAAFWSNPRRTINRLFLSLSLHAVLWLMALGTAFSSAEGSALGLFWLRASASIGAFFPLHFWLIQENLAAEVETSWSEWLKRNWVWVAISVALASVPFSHAFIPPESTAQHRLRGWGYYSYILVDVALYGFLFRDAFRRVKVLVGVRKLELQLWLGGGCVIALTVLGLMALTDVTKDPSYIRIQPLMVLLFYSVTAFAITTHQIFDARQIVLVGLERLVLVAIVAGAAYLIHQAFNNVIPEPLDFLATTAVALWFAASLSGRLDRIFRFYPQATEARQAAFAAARSEGRVEGLEQAFLNVLKGWGQSDHALLVHGSQDGLRGGGVELAGDASVLKSMRRLNWATPERLARERTTPELEEVARFLGERQLGALVIGEGQTLTTLVGVGIPASRRPFTYPQVEQLLELASIMGSALERSVFAAKAQRAEQLATVGLLGASLAHEIRNPLVTIKTFAQLLPDNYQDAAFREKFFQLIGNEIGRIDRLTEQLLDLAAPRNYLSEPVQLHPLIEAGLDLVTAKAADRRIDFIMELKASPDQVMTDPSAVKQVVLNLCFNAIQAVESRESDRWVRLSTRNVDGGVEMAVSDNGPGIAPEMRPRLFQPFQTTKSSGFGLGLAICSDILANVHATISVDPTAAGRGATFRVVFPCQPSSS